MTTRTRLRVRRVLILCGVLAAPTVLLGVEAEGPLETALAGAPKHRQVSRAGRELFRRIWSPRDPRSHGGDGLGPVFNGQSCIDCHDQGGPGGAGGVARNIVVASAAGPEGYGFAYSFAMDFGSGRFEYRLASQPSQAARRKPAVDPNLLATIHPGFRDSPSVVLHRFGTDPAYHTWRESIAGLHGLIQVRTAERNPTPLFGMGAIDAIPDAAIEAGARRKSGPSSRVKGRVGRTGDGRVGRFGWKAQTATLETFVLSAAATELGLEVPGHHQAADPRLPGLGAPGPDMNAEECAALVSYVRDLPTPEARPSADAAEEALVLAGEATFKAIGCADCHVRKLGDVDRLYSDLLLHDMGTHLGDSGVYGVLVAGPNGPGGAANAPAPRPAKGRGEALPASPQEWRTPPLWGLRDSAPYLHDGRARTLDEAIAQHGGQGATSARRHGDLSPRRKQQLQAFLMSLVAPTQP